MSTLVIALSITCFISNVVLVVLAVSNVKLWIELRSMQKSTHQIMMPTSYADSVFEKTDEKTKENIDKAFSDYVGIN